MGVTMSQRIQHATEVPPTAPIAVAPIPRLSIEADKTAQTWIHPVSAQHVLATPRPGWFKMALVWFRKAANGAKKRGKQCNWRK
jgi:hypothetical protein